jgi:hypothetical protein
VKAVEQEKSPMKYPNLPNLPQSPEPFGSALKETSLK